MNESLSNSYDLVTYPGLALPRTHPDRLATLATLFGMRPAASTACRVLELGCGSGENLIAIASTLPHSSFIGIDLSARQVALGQAMIVELGLANITLQQLNILDLPHDSGEFDYIIVPGVYSWVPWAVQEQILAICRRHLAPQGVAYISYNTLPGWHVRGMVRDILMYHTRDATTPEERIAAARSLIELLVRVVRVDPEPTDMRDAYGLLLRAEHELLLGAPDGYVLHDLLEEVNEPVYFTHFVERADRHGLQYLSEAHFAVMMPGTMPEALFEELSAITTNLIELEQYLDFARNRTFRQTLLCHEELALRRELEPALMLQFQVASPARPVSETPDLISQAPESFRAPNGTQVTIARPLCKAAMAYLAEIWPQAASFETVLQEARVRSAAKEPFDQEDQLHLGEVLLNTYAIDLIELYINRPVFARHAGEYPLAAPLARLQARDGELLTTLRHEPLALDDPLVRQLLPLLDGTRDRAALQVVLIGLVADGKLSLPEGEGVADAIERMLAFLARSALLLA